MPHHSVEFLFDPATEQAVLESWDALDAAGVPTRLRDAGIRPHLTVASVNGDLGDFPDTLRAIAARSRPIPLVFVAAGTFGGDEGVVYLAPVVSAELLRLHAELSGACERHGLTLDGLYRPGKWTPHCTQSLFLDESQVAEAITVSKEALPIRGEIVAVVLHEIEIERPPDRLPEVTMSRYGVALVLGDEGA